MRATQAVSLTLIVWMFCSPLAVFGQTGSTKQSTTKKAATSADQTATLTKEVQQYQTLLQNPDVISVPALSSAIKEKWITATCQLEVLSLPPSVIQNPTFVDQLSSACSARLHAAPSPAAPAPAAPTQPGTKPAQKAATPPSTPVEFPAGVQAPAGCLTFPAISFDTSTPANNDAKKMGPPTLDLEEMVRLNATGSGGEIYTKSSVYVAFVNRLRYTVSLGGVVSVIAAPTLPFDQILTTSPLAKPPSPNAGKGGGNPLAPGSDEFKFSEFIGCYNHIFPLFIGFQGKLGTEELLLNTTKLRISAATNNLQPIVETADEARSAADLTIFPGHESPPFPSSDLAKLRSLVADFQTQFPSVSAWATAHDTSDNNYAALYQLASTGMAAISKELDQYLAITGSASTANAATNQGGANDSVGANTGDATNSGGANQNTVKSSSNPTKTSAPGNGGAASTSEASDYEAARVYVDNWRQIFRTVAGANDDYFVVTFKPACGGFFGNGTSTQMQLSVTDSLNPPAAGAKVTPVNLDSVVCEPTLSVSNGLGLSFIPSQTPAFVPSSNGASGNTAITQSLGYSSQSHVSAGYALQANASLWEFHNWDFEIHWSVGAMLTASASGTTTDIVTGPSFSFRRRTFFISPMYDLGLRTVYVPPFRPGMPQGSLTSPPTQQLWKSGFGVTITFPFSTGTKNTNSANGGATVTNPQQAPATPGTTPATPGKTPATPGKTPATPGS